MGAMPFGQTAQKHRGHGPLLQAICERPRQRWCAQPACRSALGRRCLSVAPHKSIAGMARSYRPSAGGPGNDGAPNLPVGAPSGAMPFCGPSQEHRGHGPLLQAICGRAMR
jgi:hypothetical protein